MIQSHPSFTVYMSATSSGELYLTVSVDHPAVEARKVTPQIYQTVMELLERSQARIVQERVFGTLDVYPMVIEAREKSLRDSVAEAGGPLTFVQGHPLSGSGLAGLQITAVHTEPARSTLQTIFDEGIPCGKQWTCNGANFILLQNLHGLKKGEIPRATSSLQAERMFDRADRILRQCGATYQDVMRTWIYLSAILDWYAEFNVVRSAKYEQWALMPGVDEAAEAAPLRLPASTGIRGDHPLGAACVMDLLAITGPPESRPEVVQMTNHKQQDAFRYGRAFSRGACIRTGESLNVHISGTAAIDEQGQSLFPDDPRAQIMRTYDNIEALIAPVGANLSHIRSATVFLKRPEDVPVYQQVAAERGLTHLPAVYTIADVCRPELLFEIDAVVGLD